VRYGALRGDAADKLAALERAGADIVRPLVVRPPHHRFAVARPPPARYLTWPSLAQVLPFHREGVQTNRDAVAIDDDRERLLARLRAFAAGADDPNLAAARGRLRHYDPGRARAAVAQALADDPEGARGVSAARLAYRPHVDRWFCPVAPFCHRPRIELRAAMARSALALVTVRKDRGAAPWSHFGAVTHVPDSSYLSTRSSCRTRAFPTKDPRGRDNLEAGVAARLSHLAGRAVDARAFVHYALAVLAAPRYRARFDAELHVDYPRVPLPPDAATFDAIGRAGAALAALLCAGGAATDVLAARMRDLDRLVAGLL
jgi:hypothetical protein